MIARHHFLLAVGIVFLSNLSLAPAERGEESSDNGDAAVAVNARATGRYHHHGKSLASKAAIQQDRALDVKEQLSKEVGTKIGSALHQRKEASMQVSSAEGKDAEHAEKMRSREAVIVNAEFKGDSGVRCSESGEVTRVVQGSRADAYGVQVGWQISGVDGAPFPNHILDKIKTGQAYRFSFFIPWQVQFAFVGHIGVQYTLPTSRDAGGYIEGVTEGGEAHARGVRAGYRILFIDHIPFSEQLFHEKVASGKPYWIEFEKGEEVVMKDEDGRRLCYLRQDHCSIKCPTLQGRAACYPRRPNGDAKWCCVDRSRAAV